MKRIVTRALALAAGSLLVLSACGTGGIAEDPAARAGDADAGAARDLDYAVIIHGNPDGAFWDAVKKGAEDGAAQYGVNVGVTGDIEGSRQAQLIDSAIANEPDGIVVSMANPDALEGSIRAAIEAGIPVITINSGDDRSAEFGAIAHFGQPELAAGEQSGGQFQKAGATKALCLIHEAGNIGLEQRCQGFAEGFDGEVENLQVDLNNPQGIQATVKSKLLGDPEIDAILGLEASVTTNALAGIEQSGEEVMVGSFAVDDEVMAALKDGSVLFAVDQQQYLQGYLPIAMLVLHHDNGSTLSGGQPVLTGPAFITKDNVDEVEAFVAQGTR